MNDFDTSMWREFKVKDVLGNAKLGKYHNPETLHEDANGYLYICASAQNNGVNKQMPRVNGENLSITPSKIISWGKQCPMFTYHDEPCVTGQGIYYLDMSKYDEKVSLFICAVLKRAIGNAFGYTNCLIGSILDDIEIKLPVTKINEPDWNYMQERIAELEQERIAELERERIAELEQYLIVTGLNDYELTEEDKRILTTKLTDGGASQSSESGNGCWKEARKFKLVDIANVSYGTKFDKNKMSHVSPQINFVSRTAINNGVSDCVDECEIKPFVAGTITLALGGSIGSCFIQEKPYYTGQNVGVIELPTFVTDKAKVYFVGALQKECKAQFTAFANEINRHLKTTLSVLLPTTSNGQPDWDFMDKYIHAIEKAVIADVVKYKDEIIMNTKTIA